MTSPYLLTPRDWQWWFGVSGPEAGRLVLVQQALLKAGFDPCPDTTLGMSRTVLADEMAAQRLRDLGRLWELCPAPPVAADAMWPLPDAPNRARPGPELRAEATRCRGGRR